MFPQNKDKTSLKLTTQAGDAKPALTEPVNCYWIYFNLNAEEVYRLSKSTPKTFIQSINNIKNPKEDLKGWVEVPMPQLITERVQSKENTRGKIYQKNDYLIAARTGLFNQTKNNERLILYTDGGNPIPPSETKLISNLDPTLVKAVAIQESNNGVDGNKDLLTANNPGDYGKYKEKFGLKKMTKPNESESLYYGIRFIASKGYKGGTSVMYDNKNGIQTTTYTFQGWKNAIKNYNGGGIKNYEKYVWEMYEKAETIRPKDY